MLNHIVYASHMLYSTPVLHLLGSRLSELRPGLFNFVLGFLSLVECFLSLSRLVYDEYYARSVHRQMVTGLMITVTTTALAKLPFIASGGWLP